MGQYFIPINLTKKKCLYSWDYDNGLLQMEHSWLNNDFVHQVYARLTDSWKGDQIVWAGDYGDDEEFEMYTLQHYPPDYPYTRTLYKMCDTHSEGDELQIFPKAPKIHTHLKPEAFINAHPILVNLDCNEYVDLLKCPSIDGWAVHPLPILTSTTNTGSLGDYKGTNMTHCGRWKGNRLSVVKQPPSGFQELVPNFVEAEVLHY